jgi:hypothetical protein
MWEGEFVATEPLTAAGFPPMDTVDTVPLLKVPLKAWGSGVGTGPPGDGTITICVSTAMAVL